MAVSNCFSPSSFMSVIHSARTASWLLNVIVFSLGINLFVCVCFVRGSPTLSQLFLIILFHSGYLPHRTSHYSSSLYKELQAFSLVTPHLSLLPCSLSSSSGPPYEPLLELRHKTDGWRGRCCNKPLTT